MIYLLDKVDNGIIDTTIAKWNSMSAQFKATYDTFTTAAARDFERDKRQLKFNIIKMGDKGSLAEAIATVGDVILTYGGIKTSLMTDENDKIHWHTWMFKAMHFKVDTALQTTGAQITMDADEEASMISILESLLHDDSRLYSKLGRLIRVEEVIEPKDFVDEFNKILALIH